MKKLKTKLKITADTAAGELILDFEQLKPRYNVHNFLLKNIRENLGFSEPTPIQMQAIPALIEGNEVIACAPTGSGKTAAFSIPMLARLNMPVKGKSRGLIISPTRELAIQTYQQIQKLCIGPGFRSCVLTKSTCPVESETLTRQFGK
jgi:ATP-dependent RNA helicase DDX52/ROK1